MTIPYERSGERKCMTCYGSGETSSIHGPTSCPDCMGTGSIASTSVITERRLRDLENRYVARDSDVADDVQWLISQIRGARAALTKILALCHELPEANESMKIAGFIANEALDLYVIRPDPNANHGS